MLYDDEFIARAIRGQYAEYGGRDDFSLNFMQKILLYILKSGMIICYALIWIICRIPVFSSLFETFARTYSRGSVGFFLRGAYYKNKLKRMGKNVFIDMGVSIWEPGNVQIDDYSFLDVYITIYGGGKGHGFVRIGKYVDIAPNCVLAGRGGIVLGDHIGIGAGSKIFSGTHHYKDPEGEDDKLLGGSILEPSGGHYIVEKTVTMGDYSWMGINSIVLPGVTIGKAAVIGANSLVNKDIPAYTVATGSPAKVIKNRPKITE